MSEHMPRYVRGKAAYKAHLWDTEDTFRLVGLHIAAVIQPLQLIRRFLFLHWPGKKGEKVEFGAQRSVQLGCFAKKRAGALATGCKHRSLCSGCAADTTECGRPEQTAS